MSDRLPAAAAGTSSGRPASIAVSHPASAAEAAAASTSGFQPTHRRKDSLPTPTRDELRYTVTVTATMAHSESFMDDPQSSTMFEAKGLWREAFKSLYEFYQHKLLCDVEIECGKKTVSCHRVVLACISRYFRTMFTSEMKECHKEKITINDIDDHALVSLVNFAYTAKIKITVDNVQSLLYASSILQIETVATACSDFMKSHLDPPNCIGVHMFAEQHGRLELMRKADQYIQDHFLDVMDCEEYMGMSPKLLISLVESEDLNVNDECDVYQAVMKWVKHDVEGRKQYLSTLISKIKLPLLPATYLLEKVQSEELVRRDLECRDYLDEAKYYQLSLAQVIPDVNMSEKIRPRKSYSGVVFCVGGRGASGDPFKTIECYDIRRDKWFQVTEMSTRRRHVGVVSVGGKLYAIGGHDGSDHLNSGEMFDPTSNKWKPMSPMTTLRRGIALACLGGPIYAVGGLDDSTCFNSVERYDIESDTWSFVQSMIMPRGGVAVATLKGYLYAIGGNDGATSLDSCERYDPHLNKWTMMAAMNKRRAGAGVAELNGRLYVIGGFDDNSPLESVERYDALNNTWKMVAKMSCPRGGVGVAALGGRIYAVGGHDGSNYLNSVEAYDPITDSWEEACGIGVCRAGAGIAVVDCRIEALRDITKLSLIPPAEESKCMGESIGKHGNGRVCCLVKCSVVTRKQPALSASPQSKGASSDMLPLNQPQTQQLQQVCDTRPCLSDRKESTNTVQEIGAIDKINACPMPSCSYQVNDTDRASPPSASPSPSASSVVSFKSYFANKYLAHPTSNSAPPSSQTSPSHHGGHNKSFSSKLPTSIGLQPSSSGSSLKYFPAFRNGHVQMEHGRENSSVSTSPPHAQKDVKPRHNSVGDTFDTEANPVRSHRISGKSSPGKLQLKRSRRHTIASDSALASYPEGGFRHMAGFSSPTRSRKVAPKEGSSMSSTESSPPPGRLGKKSPKGSPKCSSTDKNNKTKSPKL